MNIKSAMRAGRALGEVQRSGVLRHPVLKMATKYWWFSIPAGLALYGKIRERMDKDKGKKVKLYAYFADAASIAGPILTLVSVMELAERLDQKGKLDKPLAAPAVLPSTPAATQETPPPYLQRTT